jgi:VWFA-related protein
MNNRRLFFALIVMVGSILSVGCSIALCQDESPEKVETILLNIPVFLSDKDRNPILGLTKDDFELIVDGKKQEIDFFTDRGPVNIAIMIDSNSITSGVLDRIKRDAMRLVDLLSPEDRAIIIQSDLGYKVASGLSSDRKKLRRAIDGIESSTASIRGMDKVLHQIIFDELSGVKGPKAVVILGDPDSAVSSNRNREYYSNPQNFLAESDVTVFPVFYQTRTFPKELEGKKLSIEALQRIPPIDSFSSYADLTGGKFYAAGADNFKDAWQEILVQLRNQYVLSFHPDIGSGQILKNVVVTSRHPYTAIRARPKITSGNAEERQKLVTRLRVGRRP